MKNQVLLSNFKEYSIEELNNMVLTYVVKVSEEVNIENINDEDLMCIEFKTSKNQKDILNYFNCNLIKLKPLLDKIVDENKFIFQNRKLKSEVQNLSFEDNNNYKIHFRYY